MLCIYFKPTHFNTTLFLNVILIDLSLTNFISIMPNWLSSALGQRADACIDAHILYSEHALLILDQTLH